MLYDYDIVWLRIIMYGHGNVVSSSSGQYSAAKSPSYQPSKSLAESARRLPGQNSTNSKSRDKMWQMGIVQIVLSHIATLGMALPGENRRKRCLCSGWMWFVGSRHLQTQHDVAREVDGSFWNTKTGSFLNTRTGSNQNTKTGSFLKIQTNKNTGKSHFIRKFTGKMLRPRT